MEIDLVNIGYGNIISAQRVIAVIRQESAPVKRLIQEARLENRLIDATYGRKTRAVLIMDSNHIVLSPVLPETVANRFNEIKSKY